MRLDTIRRRRLAALAAALVLVAVAVGVIVAVSGGSATPPAQDATRLVPAGALVYVHLSTDRGRDAVRRAQDAAQRFPSWAGARDAVLRRLAVGASGDEVSRWLGREMALALLPGDGGSAGSLVLLDVRDRGAAKAFVARGARQSGPSQTYRGVRVDRYGAVDAAFVGHFLALGQEASVHQAIDLQQGRGASLARDATYRRVSGRLPGDRVADAYVTADGLRRLLAPAGGALGLAGTLLDRPSLKATALSVSPGDPGARVQVDSLVPGHRATAFDPSLLDAIPKGAMAAYDARGLDRTATRLLAATGTASLGRLLDSAAKALGAGGVKLVQQDLLGLLRGETAVALLPGIPAPTLVVIAHTPDEARTRAALDRLVRALPKLKVTRRGDVLALHAGSTEVDAAVFDGRLVLATGPSGIAAARDPGGGIGDAGAYRAVVGNLADPVTSVVFLDFSQLLKLGEQTGLNDSRAFLAVRGDLERVRSVGASSTGTGEDTTSEIRFQIR